MSKESDEAFTARINEMRAENEKRSLAIRVEATERRERLRRALAGPRKRFKEP